MARKKTGRNDPCPCGSGKKYKKCCLDKDREAERSAPASGSLGGLRMDDEVLNRWSTDWSQFTPLAAEAVALGRELPGLRYHPWTRARIRDWFAQFEHPAARMQGVTLSEVRQETTAALFERLAQRSVELEEASFEREARERPGRSAWDLAAGLIDREAERVPVDFGLAVCELWRRLLADRPSLEMLDELMQEGYDVLDQMNPRPAVERWFSLTEHLVEALPERVRDFEAAHEVFHGLQCISNWVFDAEMHVHNASLADPDLARRGVAWCKALVARFPDAAGTSSLRMEQAQLHMMAGELHEAEAVAEALRAEDPHDAAGYVALAHVYAWSKSGELYDRDRAACILEEAIRLPVRNADDFDLAYRLKDLRSGAG